MLLKMYYSFQINYGMSNIHMFSAVILFMACYCKHIIVSEFDKNNKTTKITYLHAVKKYYIFYFV